jgi:hypothetical protein
MYNNAYIHGLMSLAAMSGMFLCVAATNGWAEFSKICAHGPPRAQLQVKDLFLVDTLTRRSKISLEFLFIISADARVCRNEKHVTNASCITSKSPRHASIVTAPLHRFCAVFYVTRYTTKAYTTIIL